MATNPAKHTPGPWRVVRDREQSTRWKGISVCAPDRFVANLVMQLDDRELANARLIAAAPEMWDALQMCKDLMGRNFPQTAQDVLNRAEGRP